MKCPRCESDQVRKNGRPNGRQRYLCKACRKQFFEPAGPKSFSRKCTETRLSEAIPQGIESAITTESGGIAILLLDAENLKLKVNTEQFLASLCDYPLQVKIAFANWKNPSIGKLDAELYDHGYELIHVPGGANSADGKMIAFGAAILYRYRDVRQVFVCSSDGLLNHLCNQLRNQGLTVFRVRRQNSVLSVENCENGESKHYSCEREEEIPSFAELANQVAELLKAEHKSIDERIARFSTVAELFQERRTVLFPSTTSNAAALSESAEDKISSGTKDCVTPLVVDLDIESQKVPETKPVNSIEIHSLDALEKILVAMIAKAIVDLKQNTIPVTKIKKQFYTEYQCPADLLVKKFLPDSSLINFFKSRPSVFKMELLGNEHQVAIAPKAAAASKTESSAALESSIANIVLALTAKSPGNYIGINQVATEFHKQYGQPITKKLQSLHLGSNFHDFLQSCQKFKVQKKGKEHQVAIAQSAP
ncbi:IS1/IS1595 family N-terminal zinc-binding domain-containing protein [Microcoleus sp. S13_C5]|uniref:IS1/IS1595 family N-terminal zinc-binding domain-containing protein n=1 Tax=Microcoleus sp. S13_C5 TaxID=3055411 RepID=UPI00403F9FE8